MMANSSPVFTWPGFAHTMWDTVDKVALNDLREVGSVAARLALRISREEPWPVRRWSPQAVQALMAAEPSLEGQSLREAVERLYARRSAKDQTSGTRNQSPPVAPDGADHFE